MKSGTRGLLLATAASISNAGFELSGKRALGGGQFFSTVFWIRAGVALTFTFVMAAAWLHDPSHVWLFRVGWMGLVRQGLLSPLLLSTFLVAVSNLLYYRALQIAPLSQTIPLFGFTPVFLLITGYLFFSNVPTSGVMLGVALIVLGTVMLHWNGGAAGALRALAASAGARLMLLSSLLLAVTNHLDQVLVMKMDALSYSWAYSMLCAVFALAFLLGSRGRGRQAMPVRPRWIALAAVVDAVMLLLQMASLKYIDVVVTIALKRSGMILSVLGGWLIFREKMGPQRLIAASVVLTGALMMYLDFPVWLRWGACGGGVLAAAYLAGFGQERPRISGAAVPQD
jgi:drug/metabolite transporter (DMT)-like permease